MTRFMKIIVASGVAFTSVAGKPALKSALKVKKAESDTDKTERDDKRMDRIGAKASAKKFRFADLATDNGGNSVATKPGHEYSENAEMREQAEVREAEMRERAKVLEAERKLKQITCATIYKTSDDRSPVFEIKLGQKIGPIGFDIRLEDVFRNPDDDKYFRKRGSLPEYIECTFDGHLFYHKGKDEYEKGYKKTQVDNTYEFGPSSKRGLFSFFSKRIYAYRLQKSEVVQE